MAKPKVGRCWATGRSKKGKDSSPKTTIPEDGFALFDILGQIEADDTQSSFLFPDGSRTVAIHCAIGVEQLQNLKLDGAFREVVVAVDGNANRDNLGVVVLNSVVGNGTFVRLATVFPVNAVWEVPFYYGCS